MPDPTMESYRKKIRITIGTLQEQVIMLQCVNETLLEQRDEALAELKKYKGPDDVSDEVK